MNSTSASHFQLADGRNLSYSDTGTGENGTWIHCHGIPGSRYELAHLNNELMATGSRIIIPDRPGYGASTPCPGYDFARHTADLRQLADYLGLAQVSVSGFSGGGVFAMALAHDLGDRVGQLTIAATPAVPLMNNPWRHASKLTANSWRAALDNTDALAAELQALTGSAEVLSEALLEAVGARERLYLSSLNVASGFGTNMGAALKQGPERSAEALARDTSLTARPWPFEPGQIKARTRIIHGTEDELVHQAHQAALVRQLPGSESHVGNCGHFSVLPFLMA